MSSCGQALATAQHRARARVGRRHTHTGISYFSSFACGVPAYVSSRAPSEQFAFCILRLFWQVCTDDEEMAHFAASQGTDVLRLPRDLCGDKSPALPVLLAGLRHAYTLFGLSPPLNEAATNTADAYPPRAPLGGGIDAVCVLRATSPCRLPSDVARAVRLFLERRARVRTHPQDQRVFGPFFSSPFLFAVVFRTCLMISLNLFVCTGFLRSQSVEQCGPQSGDQTVAAAAAAAASPLRRSPAPPPPPDSVVGVTSMFGLHPSRIKTVVRVLREDGEEERATFRQKKEEEKVVDEDAATGGVLLDAFPETFPEGLQPQSSQSLRAYVRNRSLPLLLLLPSCIGGAGFASCWILTFNYR